jgi:hypothetical protein
LTTAANKVGPGRTAMYKINWTRLGEKSISKELSILRDTTVTCYFIKDEIFWRQRTELPYM